MRALPFSYVFATVLMMTEGIRATLVATGQADNVIVLRKGAGADLGAVLGASLGESLLQSLQSLLCGLFMGFVGGFIPAWRAARLKIVDCLRAA